MAKIDLTPAQKDEIRRLTQLANRRIKFTEKAYAKEGKSVLPQELVGEFQIREKWQTATSPLSRSVKFESEAAYNAQLAMLKEFETKRVGIKEYTQIQRVKTAEGIKTSMGLEELPLDFQKKLDKMTAPQLSDFWNSFSEKAVRMGTAYSSLSLLEDTLREFFPEDVVYLLQTAKDEQDERDAQEGE